MPDRDQGATVIQMPVARLTQIQPSSNVSLDVNRLKMRRHILAALLHHGADGLRGDCYCGAHPRSLWLHMEHAVADSTHLLRGYVSAIMDEHRRASGQLGVEMRCICGDTYIDQGIGRDEHFAEALAANLPEPEVARCLTEIRKAGQAR